MSCLLHATSLLTASFAILVGDDEDLFKPNVRYNNNL